MPRVKRIVIQGQKAPSLPVERIVIKDGSPAQLAIAFALGAILGSLAAYFGPRLW